jgi:microcin C transport system permease protein
MGYFGGKVDLFGQRLVEIWSNMPFLYIVIIIYSLTPPGDAFQRIVFLLLIMVGFSWTGLTYFMRTGTYREKARDYVAAAQVIGAGTLRVIFKHVLPNTIATVVTFIPFIVAQAIIAVTALDFLGFGLPPPTPSWGELLKQGREHITDASWILLSTFVVMASVLTLITFVGEAVREAFDPKKFTIYT